MTKPALSQLPLSLSYCGFKALFCSGTLPMSDFLFNDQEIQLSNVCPTQSYQNPKE